MPFYAIIEPLLRKTLHNIVKLLLTRLLLAVLSIAFMSVHFCINERAHNIWWI